MPVERDNFDKFKDTTDADLAACRRIGVATLQVAMPICPVDTGNLLKSHEVKFDISGEFVDVGVTADYGGYVHNGTSRQAAQPWLKTAVERNKEALAKEGVAAWRMNMDIE